MIKGNMFENNNDDSILKVNEAKDWVSILYSAYKNVSEFLIEEPIGEIFKKLDCILKHVENYPIQIAFCGRPRVGKSYILNYLMTEQLGKEHNISKLIGHYPCPTSPGLQPTTRIPVKFEQSDNHSIKLSVKVCHMKEYIKRVQYEMKEGYSIDEFGLNKDFTKRLSSNDETNQIFEWMNDQCDISHQLFVYENIEEGLVKCHEFINHITNYNQPYLRIWETAVDMIIISLPNDKLHLKSFMDIPGLTEINFRSKKITKACEKVDIVVFVCDNHSACTLQDLEVLDTYEIIKDTTDHPPFPIILVNETRSNSLKPRGPYTIIDDVKGCTDTQKRNLTFLESIKHRFLSDCRSDASVNSKFLFHDFQSDIRESIFTDLRENVCCLIFYPIYDDYNSVDEFWKFIEKGDLLKRNEMLREDGIRYIRLIISCLTTILKQLKKKKRIFLPSSINKRKNDKIDSMINNIQQNMESMAQEFKNHIDIHIDEDITISFKNLLKSIIHDLTFQISDLNIEQFLTSSVDLLQEEYEGVVIQSFYKEGTERKPYLLTEMERLFSFLVEQIASLDSFKLNFESLKKLLKENGEHFINVSSKMIPPSIKDIRNTITNILNNQVNQLIHCYYHELKKTINDNYEHFINELTNYMIHQSSESIKKDICYHYIDLFMNETSKFIKMIQSLMNQNYKSDFISIEKIKMLHNNVQSVHKRLTLYKAAMPFGYQPETIHGKYTCISTRRLMKPIEFKSNTLHIIDQNFKKNGNLLPNRNDTVPFKIHIINDNDDVENLYFHSLNDFSDIFIISINTTDLSTHIHSKAIQSLKNSLHESSYLNNSIISIICDYNNRIDIIEYIDMHDRINYKCILLFYYYFDDDMIRHIHSIKPTNTTILHILFDPIPSQFRFPDTHLYIHGYALSFIKSLAKILNVEFCVFLQPNLIATREYHKKTNMLEVSTIHRSILTMIKTFEHLKERQSDEIMSFLNQKIKKDEALKLGFTINEDEGYYYDEDDTIIKNIYHQYASVHHRNRLFYKICHDDQHKISKDPSILLKFIQCKQLKQQLENHLILKSINRVALISVSGNRSSKMKRSHWKGCTFKESSTHSPFCLLHLKSIEGYNFISRKSLENGYHRDTDHSSNGRPMSLLNIWKRLTQILREDGFLCYSIFNIQTITDDIEPHSSQKRKKKPFYSDILKSIHLLHSSSYRKNKKGLPLVKDIEQLYEFNEAHALMINETQKLQMKLIKMNQMIDMTWFRKNDNDYFYEGLSVSVIGEKYAANEILSLITDELIHHQNMYIDLFISRLKDSDKLIMNKSMNHHHKSILFNKYVNDLRSKKIPADYLCLLAFSRSLKRDIVIYISNGNGNYGYYRIRYDSDSINEDGRITLIYMKSKKSTQVKFVPIVEKNNPQIGMNINSTSDNNQSPIINNKRKRKRSNYNDIPTDNKIQSNERHETTTSNILKDKDLNNIISDSNKRIKFNELSSFLVNRLSSKSIIGLNHKTNIVNYSYSQHLRIIEIASIYGAFTDSLSKDHLMNLAIYTNIGESENINNWIGELDPDDIYNTLMDLRKMAFKFVKGNKRIENENVNMAQNVNTKIDELNDSSNYINELIKCQCPNDHKDIFMSNNDDSYDDKYLNLKHFTLKTTGRSITYQKLKQIYLSTIFFDHWHFEKYDPYIDAFLEDDLLYKNYYKYIEKDIPSYIPTDHFPYHIFIILARILNKVGFNTIDKWQYILENELEKKLNDLIEIETSLIDKSKIKKIILELVKEMSDFKIIMMKTQSFFDEYIGSMENL